MSDQIAKLRELRATMDDYKASDRQDRFFLAFDMAEALLAVAEAAESVCRKLEHPTASVTIDDQLALRQALSSLQGAEQ